MTEIDEGYYFWKRVDLVRPRYETLKQVVEEAQLNYHLVKVQRSCNRIPKALDAAKLAIKLEVSLEWLLTGKILDVEYKHDIYDVHKRQQMNRIFQVLLTSDTSKWRHVESALGIRVQQES